MEYQKYFTEKSYEKHVSFFIKLFNFQIIKNYFKY